MFTLHINIFRVCKKYFNIMLDIGQKDFIGKGKKPFLQKGTFTPFLAMPPG